MDLELEDFNIAVGGDAPDNAVAPEDSLPDSPSQLSAGKSSQDGTSPEGNASAGSPSAEEPTMSVDAAGLIKLKSKFGAIVAARGIAAFSLRIFLLLIIVVL